MCAECRSPDPSGAGVATTAGSSALATTTTAGMGRARWGQVPYHSHDNPWPRVRAPTPKYPKQSTQLAERNAELCSLDMADKPSLRGLRRGSCGALSGPRPLVGPSGDGCSAFSFLRFQPPALSSFCAFSLLRFSQLCFQPTALSAFCAFSLLRFHLSALSASRAFSLLRF